MKHIDEAILNYVEQKNTDYAVLLTGKWGSGKTYYLNNTLKVKIEEKGFKMIVISLYGISSIKEISSMIFAEKSPKLSKIIKYGGPILNSFLKSVDIADYLKFGIDEIDKNKDTNISINQGNVVDESNGWFDKFYKQKKENIDTEKENILLCFDDLERKNDSLSNKEIIGYVNNLAEKGTKIIVLVHEERVESFDELKEKTFGLALSFKQTYENAISGILKTNFENEKGFQTYIKTHVESINEYFFKHHQNLRILKFGLNCFYTIFSKIEIEKDNFKYLNYNEICNDLLRFVLAISIEFREGRISFDKGNGIDNNITKTDQDIYALTRKLQLNNNDSSQIEQIKSYKDSFLEKYYPNSQYTYFSSIFNYITSGYLDTTELFSELQEIDRKTIKPEYQLYNKLFSNGFYGLIQFDDNELQTYFQKIIKYAQEGVYKELNEYSTIYFFISNYSEYGFDLKSLESTFLEVIKKRVLPDTEINALKNFQRYQKYLDESNEQDKSNSLWNNILELIYNELEQRSVQNLDNVSLEQIILILEKDEYSLNLGSLNTTLFFDKLSNSENSLLRRLFFVLKNRWLSPNFLNIESEKVFIKTLNSLIATRNIKSEEKNKNITFNWIHNLLQDKSQRINNIEEHNSSN